MKYVETKKKSLNKSVELGLSKLIIQSLIVELKYKIKFLFYHDFTSIKFQTVLIILWLFINDSN